MSEINGCLKIQMNGAKIRRIHTFGIEPIEKE